MLNLQDHKMTEQICGLENARPNHLHAFMHFPVVSFGPSISTSCIFSCRGQSLTAMQSRVLQLCLHLVVQVLWDRMV